MKSFHRSRGLRAIAAFVLVLASGGAETAHGSAHSERHAAKDVHSHEATGASVSGGNDKDHGHERVANGIVVRSLQWGIVSRPAETDFQGVFRDSSAAVFEVGEDHLGSIATGPPPRLRAPPVA